MSLCCVVNLLLRLRLLQVHLLPLCRIAHLWLCSVLL